MGNSASVAGEPEFDAVHDHRQRGERRLDPTSPTCRITAKVT
jgi:hypothetical protein